MGKLINPTPVAVAISDLRISETKARKRMLAYQKAQDEVTERREKLRVLLNETTPPAA